MEATDWGNLDAIDSDTWLSEHVTHGCACGAAFVGWNGGSYQGEPWIALLCTEGCVSTWASEWRAFLNLGACPRSEPPFRPCA